MILGKHPSLRLKAHASARSGKLPSWSGYLIKLKNEGKKKKEREKPNPYIQMKKLKYISSVHHHYKLSPILGHWNYQYSVSSERWAMRKAKQSVND